MRLEAVHPDRMTEEQQRLQDEMGPLIEANLKGFETSEDDGALIGPFAPMLRYPAWGAGVWAQTKSVVEHADLPKGVREVVILVTGAATGAVYELYAHERVGEGAGLAETTVATIVAGQRPTDLDGQQAAAYDLAAALASRGPVPDATYRAAEQALGADGAAEAVFLAAAYASVSVLLNGFAMPVPGGAV